MEAVSKELMEHLLQKCIKMAMEDAQKHISDPLPPLVYLGLGAFEQGGKEQSLNTLLFYLYKDGTIPRVVDVAVRGIKEGRTLIWIRPSGHAYVNDFAQTWNTPEGMGPFKSPGLMLPYPIWNRPRPLSAQDLKEAGEQWH